MATTEIPLHEVVLKVMFLENTERAAEMTSQDILWKIENPEISERQVREVLEWLVHHKKVSYYAGKYNLDRYEFLEIKQNYKVYLDALEASRTSPKTTIEILPETFFLHSGDNESSVIERQKKEKSSGEEPVKRKQKKAKEVTAKERSKQKPRSKPTKTSKKKDVETRDKAKSDSESMSGTEGSKHKQKYVFYVLAASFFLYLIIVFFSLFQKNETAIEAPKYKVSTLKIPETYMFIRGDRNFDAVWRDEINYSFNKQNAYNDSLSNAFKKLQETWNIREVKMVEYLENSQAFYDNRQEALINKFNQVLVLSFFILSIMIWLYYRR